MRFRILSAIVLLFALTRVAFAQSITSVQPRSVRPGETTKLTIAGKGFDDTLRPLTNVVAEVRVDAVEAEKVTLDLTLPADTTFGPMGIWVATQQGPAEPIVLLVDDLPAAGEAADNHAIESAQAVSVPVAIDGASDGAKSDYFRFHAEQGQRIAFEVVTQALGSRMDPVIRLLNPSGEQLYLADDDEVGPECRFSYQFQQAGEFVLEVRDSRYAAGGVYHLRIGDFPCVSHGFPLAIQRGRQATVQFETTDGAEATACDVAVPEVFSGETYHVATRLAGGNSSAWTTIRVSDWPQYAEADSQAEPLVLPVGINGKLCEPRELDTYRIRGSKDATFRFASRTRSLKSQSLLQMQLFNAQDARVAQTEVSDVDEWSFDYTFPDDGEYRLQVNDLLQRGGTGFGYLIEITPAGRFAIALKADAKAPEQFVISEEHGACAVDLQITRFGYDGEILLSLAQSPPGLKIVNPVIPAKANEARVYLAANSDWKAEAATLIRITGTAKDNPEVNATASSLAMHRVKQPHVPFPDEWNNGVALLSGTGKIEDYFSIEPAVPLQFGRPLRAHAATLNLKRIDEKFDGAVTLLGDQLPEGWSLAAKAEKDVHTTTWTRGEAAGEPGALPLVVYSEFKGRGRLVSTELPIQWIDPVKIRILPAEPLVAGRLNRLVVSIDREGADPQPVELKMIKLPREWTGPEMISIAADAAEVTLEVTVPANDSAEAGEIEFELTSKYQGVEFKIAGVSPTPPLLRTPTELDVYPTQITLAGKRSRRQLVVTGYDEAKSPRDWTRDATITSANPDIAEVQGGVVRGKANGDTELVVQVGELRQVIPVHIMEMESEQRTQFEAEVLVALSKQGCNSGACHGSPSGKGMFRLSLRAFDRKLDELTLIREDFGRRVNRMEPDTSLLLLKPLMKISHGGGKKLHQDDLAYGILRDWIAEGAEPDPPETPRCVRLEMFPNQKRVLSLDHGGQQLSVLAHFEDGSVRDVTDLVAYESSNTTVATVSEQGLVSPVGRGESAILVRYLEHIESLPIMFIQKSPAFQWVAPVPHNYIDELVNAKLEQLQYLPSATCSDAEFLRRVYLDVIGILPSVEESRAFLESEASDKRSQLVDQLLEREEYAKFWALKWGDLLKMTGKLVGDEGVYKYHRWVEEAFRTNMPYDQFASALISAKGSTLANPPANFYRTAADMNDCVETVSQVFLGARLQCAKCHNHPFERWTQDNYYGLGAFFDRLQRRSTQRPGEMFIWTANSGEVTQPRTGEQMKPWLPALGEIDVAAQDDRRDALVEWLTKPENPYFARMEANRIWSQCFARGIVDPIDDFRDSNPPSNAPLLDALAHDFADHGFDRKHLLRTILNSRTYQASYEANESNREDLIYFSHQRPRMLSAEQLLDAVNHVTGLAQTFGHLPSNTKATQLPAPDVVKVDFLKVFGQPERSTVCACERADSSNLGMAIELFNGVAIHEKLHDANNRFRKAIGAGQPIEDVVRDLYFASVCRPPSDMELEAALEHCRGRENLTDGLEDVCWALLNTDEFLFQH